MGLLFIKCNNNYQLFSKDILRDFPSFCFLKLTNMEPCRNYDGLQKLKRCYQNNLNILTWLIMTEWECKLGPCLQSWPLHAHTHMLAPLRSICACERDLFRAVSTLSTTLFIMVFHSECVQVFTVRRRRKGEKRKDENKRQWPQCLDGRWRGGQRPSDTEWETM